LKYAPPGGSKLGYGEVLEPLVNESSAMAMSYFAFFPGLVDKMGAKVGFFPMPKHGDRQYASLGGQGFSISSKVPAPQQELAKKFIAWFLETDTQKKWVQKPGGFTANAEILKSEAFKTASPYNAAFAQSLDLLQDFWNVPVYNELIASTVSASVKRSTGKNPHARRSACWRRSTRRSCRRRSRRPRNEHSAVAPVGLGLRRPSAQPALRDEPVPALLQHLSQPHQRRPLGRHGQVRRRTELHAAVRRCRLRRRLDDHGDVRAVVRLDRDRRRLCPGALVARSGAGQARSPHRAADPDDALPGGALAVLEPDPERQLRRPESAARGSALAGAPVAHRQRSEIRVDRVDRHLDVDAVHDADLARRA
jgi:hypothetical protein